MAVIHDISQVERVRIRVNGIVQGVGFRPFVYRTARSLQLTGFVQNDSTGVEIEIQGSPQATKDFVSKISRELPPLAQITSMNQEKTAVVEDDEPFTIRESKQDQAAKTLISPDIAICKDCLKELFDPQDRRYHYPFINCTNCGPRYTIIESIPYDRPKTTMSTFKMCRDCRREYKNPADRRFHAQPNACHECGPEIWIEKTSGGVVQARHDRAIDYAASRLAEGKILAIKGLGGFHLAVDALNPEAVARLRQRKNREEKPLAIMAPDLSMIKQLVRVNSEEAELLESPQCPIVLLQKKRGNPVAENVAPGNRRLGVMLPYTPLHYLLLERYADLNRIPVLVMTSANLSEEPIVMKNDESRVRLADIADFLLLHDRDILIRADDSVQTEVEGHTSFIRRSRGYVPRPVFLAESGVETMAVGGHLKNTICVLKGDQAFLSQHIGDLENLEAYHFFTESVEHLNKILETKPQLIAHDLHPGYLSTQWAIKQTHVRHYAIQHHHAHMASCMAEWNLTEPAIGIILDGTGYGYDKTIWGGEILIGDFSRVQRFAHLEPMPIPGGEKAIQEPWRLAVGYLYKTFGEKIPNLPALEGFNTEPVLQMLNKHINTPVTSSCGRLFDAISAFCNIRTQIRYEAQAAIELMQVSYTKTDTVYPYRFSAPEIVIQPMIRAIVGDIQKGIPVNTIGARFHATLIHIFKEVAIKARELSGLNTIVLSGGSFQNEILHSGLMLQLSEAGFNVYHQKQVPANDGGISLGQSVIARELYRKNQKEVTYHE